MQPDDDKTRAITVLTKGTVIDHYRIIEKIGAGGMGEVYLAEDTELSRRVALKFLPLHLCQDADCRARFKREAQAAAKLNHPDIVTIHEVSEFNGRPFFAMEHIEGQSLRELIKDKELPLEQVIGLAIQISEGLHKAHQAGIIHRDIKPANIMLDHDGRAKILDFGLAAVQGSDHLTKAGSTLGTIGYMSPEQVRGETVDHRSDIFSLGVVLYEMITGRRPFHGENDVATLHNIAYADPEALAQFRSDVPEELQGIVDKALAKDKNERYQQLDEVIADLRRLAKDPSSVSFRTPSRSVTRRTDRRRNKPFLFVALGLVAVVALAIALSRFVLQKQSRQITVSHRQVTFSGRVHEPAISPDGKLIAYVSRESDTTCAVLVRDVSGGQALEVFRGNDIRDLRWSPDGSLLMLCAANDSTGGLYIVPRLGGTPRRLIPYWFSSSWSPDGSSIAGILLAGKRITMINTATGDTASIPLHGSYNWVDDIDWSPAGNFLLCLTRSEEQREYVIWTTTADGTRQNEVTQDSVSLTSPRWSFKGEAIYYLRSHGPTKDLMKLRVDMSTGKAKGIPVLIQAGLPAGELFSLAADDHRLLYTREQSYSNLWLARYEDKEKKGVIQTTQLTTGTAYSYTPSISPDGKRIAFSMGSESERDIYTIPIEGGPMTQLTFLNCYNVDPVWSPDGKELAFGSNQSGSQKVWRISADGGTARLFEKTDLSYSEETITWWPGSEILYQRPGNQNFHFLNPVTGEERPLYENDFPGWIFGPRYSPDGRSIVARVNPAKGDRGFSIISLIDKSETFLYRTKGYDCLLCWSPDGMWIYFSLMETLRNDLLVHSPQLWKCSVSEHRAEPFLELPFRSIDYVSLDPVGKNVVCTILESNSDAWLMEDFDPDVE